MKLLDLFCGAGGAAVGYHRAGFTEIVGVDIVPQPRYPFSFRQADALEYAAMCWSQFDACHASPPCQKYSWAAKRWKKDRSDLVPATVTLLRRLGLPYVIENVTGAPLSSAIRLCGTQFGLALIRHRLFASNLMLMAPGAPCRHGGSVRAGNYVTVAGHGGENAKGHGSRIAKQRAMGIDWMNDIELNEAVPPAYTEYIGRQLIAQLVER
jgi:DNA (cytosine-5)-methyltransferase 1